MYISIHKQISISKLPAFVLSCTLSATLVLSGCSPEVKTKDASNYNADLGIRYLQKGRIQLANEKLLKALEQYPDSAQSNHYYALLQQKLGNREKADTYFRRAIGINSQGPEIRNNYGSFLCETGRHRKAVEQFLKAVKDPLYITPEYAYTNAGICLRKGNSNVEAERYFRLALKKRSSFPSALLQMAKLYKDRGEYPRAQAFMLRYENVGKSTPEALETCYIINQKIGNISKSSSCKSTLLRLFPSSSEAEKANNLL